MTKSKELLLKDLCARLPYGVKCAIFNKDLGFGGISGFEGKYPFVIDGITQEEDGIDVWIEHGNFSLETVKPYLFPLSSMTEEQKRELRQMDAFVSTFGQICFSTYDDYGHELMPTFEDAIRVENWLNKNHFDYRGLIEKGLAIDAIGLNIY